MSCLLRRAFALAIVLSFSNNLQAATVDSDDVVVTAARVAQPRDAVVGDVSVIDRATIERAGQSTLVELLQTQPGIEITSNGGYGKLSGIFMRGTNSDHVLVLIDGIRVNSATAGTTTFENLPVALIDRVEILRGPATSLYGQDAIGGVIQIFTRRGQGAPRFFANLGYGSYNNKTAEAGVHGTMGDTRFALAVSSQDIDGFSALRTSNPDLDDDDGYRRMFGGKLFDSYADHPRQVQTFPLKKGGTLSSSAAGAYQFLSKTWDGLVRQYGFEIASPEYEQAFRHSKVGA
jgi:vitamin B12 transporter